MQHFTDNLIEAYDEIKNNYLDLHLSVNSLINQIKKWTYYDKPTKFYAKPSKAEWEGLKTLFVNATDLGVIEIDPQAEIIINQDSFYIIWVHFKAADGQWYYIDGPLYKKDWYGKSNGTRRIDVKCPLVTEVLHALETNSKDTLLYKKVFDIVATRPDLMANTPEGKIQYKINGTIAEHIIEKAMTDLNIPYEVRDEYNEYFYKGSPGNICDWIVTIDGIKYKIDGKLVATDLTSTLNSTHDAAVLIGIAWKNKTAVAKSVSVDKSVAETLRNSETFKELLRKITSNYLALNKPFIGINKIDLETGEIDIYRFG